MYKLYIWMNNIDPDLHLGHGRWWQAGSQHQRRGWTMLVPAHNPVWHQLIPETDQIRILQQRCSHARLWWWWETLVADGISGCLHILFSCRVFTQMAPHTLLGADLVGNRKKLTSEVSVSDLEYADDMALISDSYDGLTTRLESLNSKHHQL